MQVKSRYYFFLLFVFGLLIGCKSNFPSDLDSFSLDMNYTTKDYAPIVGQNNYFSGNFSPGESTQPLTFRISDVRTFDGAYAPELLKLFPVKIWKTRYTGEEKSLAEIEAKRETSMRPLWEIGEHNGSFTLWESSNSTILKTFPDSCYFFDVEVSSAGGRRYFKDLKLVPRKEIPYEPYAERESISPISFVIGDSTKSIIRHDEIKVWFNRKGDGNSLSFRFLDAKLNPLKISKFKTTEWDELVHGFNKRFNADSTYLTYDVAYPIPLVQSIKTKYTSNDGYARAAFSFDYRNELGEQFPNFIVFPFRIYEKGDWEIVFYFSDEAPAFN